MKKLCMLVIMLFITQKIFAQQVGIGTLDPHSSAALHISSANKGVLFPKVTLNSKNDVAGVPNPASGLIVFNNAGTLNGKGLYFNNGTNVSPDWTSVSEFKLPYYGGAVGSANGNLFEIENFQNSASAVALKVLGNGVGTGIIAQSGAGLALDVKGNMKISGNGQTPAAGKVLTSDASGNASWQGGVAFSASGVASAILPTGESKVSFATVNYDLAGNYKDANGAPHSTFEAPVNGIYHFDALISWQGNQSSSSYALIIKRVRNGTTINLGKSSQIDLSSAELSFDCELQKNDIIYTAVNLTSIDNKTLSGSSEGSYFNGRLVIVK